MKTIVKKLIFLIALILLFISLAVIFSFNVNLENLKTITKAEALALEDETGTTLHSNGKHIDGVTLTSNTPMNNMGIPSGYICFQHGTHFENLGESIETILALKGTTYTTVGQNSKAMLTTDGTSSDHVSDSQYNVTRKSNSIYKCVNNHISLTGAAAYIISGGPYIATADGGYKNGSRGGNWVAGQDITAEIIQAYVWSNPDLNEGITIDAKD